MGGSSFELLMQEIFNQKQCMDQLIAENEDLQRQLADLRAGRGILLEICAKQFALYGETIVATPQSISPNPAQDSPNLEQPATNMMLNQVPTLEQPTVNMTISQPPNIEQPIVNMALDQVPASSILETPQPSSNEI